MDRRDALKTIAGGVTFLGATGVVGLRSSAAGRDARAPGPRAEPELDRKGKVVHQPLPYAPLDPDEIGDRAYRNKLQGDCMYGVFATLVEALAEKVGGAYADYPTTVTRYGAGGVMGWGSTCGTVNGAAMAAYLVSPDPAPIVDEVMGYFQSAELPDYRPADAIMDIPVSIGESTLCHASMSKWCKATGCPAFSMERTQRCAHLAASVARKLVQELNAQYAGNFRPAYPIPADVEDCRSCHDKGGELENTRGKMSCTTCHEKHEV